jgi:hypothetical protein
MDACCHAPALARLKDLVASTSINGIIESNSVKAGKQDTVVIVLLCIQLYKKPTVLLNSVICVERERVGGRNN